jgi:hypothetical protein
MTTLEIYLHILVGRRMTVCVCVCVCVCVQFGRRKKTRVGQSWCMKILSLVGEKQSVYLKVSMSLSANVFVLVFLSERI